MKQNLQAIPTIDLQKCTGCMICAAVCPQHAIDGKDTWPTIPDVKLCTFCGKCEDLCPSGAIQVPFVIRWNLTH